MRNKTDTLAGLIQFKGMNETGRYQQFCHFNKRVRVKYRAVGFGTEEYQVVIIGKRAEDQNDLMRKISGPESL